MRTERCSMIAIAKNDLQAQAFAQRTRRARRWLLGFWLLLVALTHFPNPYPERGEPQHFDKVVHFTLYGVLAALAIRTLTLRAERGSAIVRCLGVLAAVIAFGLFDEATQPLTGRDFDWYDWLADSLGALAGIAVYETVRRRNAWQNS